MAVAVSSTIELNKAVIRALGLEGKWVREVTFHFRRDGVVAVVEIGISDDLAATIGDELKQVAAREPL
jgi:hypothetical protein